MKSPNNHQARLPLPIWVYVVIGAPTFFMLLGVLVGFGLGLLCLVWMNLFDTVPPRPPLWIAAWVLGPSLSVTFALMPLYLVWAIISKRLSKTEKVFAVFLIIAGNMIAMPAFFVFMLRRYLGYTTKASDRDEAALDRFLQKHGVNGDKLNDSQRKALRDYCRQRQFARWTAVALVLIAWPGLILLLIPGWNALYSLGVNFRPTHYVQIDTHTGERNEVLPDPETIHLHTVNQITLGVGLGATAPMLLILPVQYFGIAFGGAHHRKALIEFLKAGP